jgi:hypothetical protein
MPPPVTVQDRQKAGLNLALSLLPQKVAQDSHGKKPDKPGVALKNLVKGFGMLALRHVDMDKMAVSKFPPKTPRKTLKKKPTRMARATCPLSAKANGVSLLTEYHSCQV